MEQINLKKYVKLIEDIKHILKRSKSDYDKLSLQNDMRDQALVAYAEIEILENVIDKLDTLLPEKAQS